MIIDSPRRREHLAAIAARMPAHVERLSWTAEQIRAERQRALRETLAHAKANSSWHASRLSRIEPDTFTEADLQALPIMTKTDVMTHWDAIVTDRRLTLAGCNAHIAAKLNGTCKDYYYLGEYQVIATGGSSGWRGVFPWSWDEFVDIACVTFRPCSCGAAFPLITAVTGRSDDIFVYPGGIHVHPLVFRTPLGQNSQIEQYQVHQTEHGARIGVIATGPIDVAALKSELTQGLAKAGLANAEIEIDLVDTLERHKETGKLRRFIPLPKS
jgi:phenylacetate-coenzyme A ligase PaaK-like adenylate-forming protein